MKNNKVKKALKEILVFLIFTAMGGAFGILLAKTDLGITPWSVVKSLLFLMLSCILHVLIHELGHLIAGKLSGYTFVSYRVGSLLIKRENGKLVTKRYSIPGTGGQCLMRPPAYNDGNYPFMFYNLGGGLLNIIVGGLALLLSATTNFADLFLFAFGFVGIILGIINLIPINGKIPNDGYNIFYLRKDKMARRSFWLQIEVNAQMSEGKRLNDMPDELFELLEDADFSNFMVLSVIYIKIGRLIENEEYEEAKTLFEQYKNEPAFLDLYRLELQSDFLGIDILDGKITDKSEVDKNTLKHLKQTPYLINHTRVLYSYFLLVDKNPKKAEQYKKQFYKTVAKYPYPAAVEEEKRVMEQIEEKVQNERNG